MRPILLILPISESPICRYNLSGSEAHPDSPVRATNVVIVDMRSTDLIFLITSLPYLSGYRGASLGMTWLASRVVETVDVGVRAWGPRP